MNSTKGKIGRSKSFFDVAFGKDIDEFNKILWMPEKYIIYRNEYKDNLTKEWWDKFVSLDQISLGFIKDIISRNKFDVDEKLVDNKVILDILNFYKV